MRYPHIWSRLYGAPLFMHPDKARILAATLRDVDESEFTEPVNPEETLEAQHMRSLLLTESVTFQKRQDKPYALTDTGIAVIPVLGSLIQRGDWMTSMSGMTSYGRISSMMNKALADYDVNGIMMEIDSFGGEANGMFDLADQIFAARDSKPVWAHVNEQAYSAAYGIAAAATEIYLPRTGGVGSIGVIMMHVDQSKKDAKQGNEYTFIHAGAHKTDFNSHQPLSDAARASAQAEVDRLYSMFVTSVASMRKIDAEAVRKTEAGLLNPDAAVAGGFATGIATFAQAMATFETELSRSTGNGRLSFSQGVHAMSDAKAAGNADTTIYTQAQLDAAVATARAETDKTSRTAERERIRGIMASEAAQGRPAAAMEMALESDLDPAVANKILAKVQKEAAGSQFSASMDKLGNPKIGADSGEVYEEKPPTVINSAAIFAARRNRPAE